MKKAMKMGRVGKGDDYNKGPDPRPGTRRSGPVAGSDAAKFAKGGHGGVMASGDKGIGGRKSNRVK